MTTGLYYFNLCNNIFIGTVWYKLNDLVWGHEMTFTSQRQMKKDEAICLCTVNKAMGL